MVTDKKSKRRSRGQNNKSMGQMRKESHAGGEGKEGAEAELVEKTTLF